MSNAPLAISARLTTATNKTTYLMNSRLRTIDGPAAGAPPTEAPGRPGIPSSRLSDGALTNLS